LHEPHRKRCAGALLETVLMDRAIIRSHAYLGKVFEGVRTGRDHGAGLKGKDLPKPIRRIFIILLAI